MYLPEDTPFNFVNLQVSFSETIQLVNQFTKKSGFIISELVVWFSEEDRYIITKLYHVYYW